MKKTTTQLPIQENRTLASCFIFLLWASNPRKQMNNVQKITVTDQELLKIKGQEFDLYQPTLMTDSNKAM